MNIEDHHLPSEVASILDWWLPRVCGVFDNHLRSVFLFGGVALGEFAPGWSDVDTYLIVREPVTREQAEEMNAILAEMDERFLKQGANGWQSGQAVQGAVVTMEQAAEVGRAEMCFYAWGSQGTREHCDPFSAFDRYMLAHHRKLLWGEDVSVAPPSRQALVEMTLETLESFFADAGRTADTQGPIMLAGLLHWAARSLVFWRDGVMLAKSAALRHESDSGSPFADAFQLALDVREKGSAHASTYDTALRDAFRTIGQPFYAEHKNILS